MNSSAHPTPPAAISHTVQARHLVELAAAARDLLAAIPFTTDTYVQARIARLQTAIGNAEPHSQTGAFIDEPA